MPPPDRRTFLLQTGKPLVMTTAAAAAWDYVVAGEPANAPDYDAAAHWWAMHRIYEADESFKTLDFMVHTRLFVSQIVVQLVVGTLAPIGLLAVGRFAASARLRRAVYVTAGVLALVCIFAMRWNVIGGQLFSKSFLGYTTYKMAFATREGLGVAIALLVLPFILLAGLVHLLPPWPAREAPAGEEGPS